MIEFLLKFKTEDQFITSQEDKLWSILTHKPQETYFKF